MTAADEVTEQLANRFGLTGVELRFGLTQEELFHEAIANDRGRVTVGGPSDAQKAFPTSLGVDGPLVYYSDPECTGRPVQDTFCVDRPSSTDKVWWKSGFARFDPDAFDALLPRVIEHLNARNATFTSPTFFAAGIRRSPSPTGLSASSPPMPTSATSCSPRTFATMPTGPTRGGR